MAGPLVAILSGAGISTDSGIPDYRGPNGLWRRDPDGLHQRAGTSARKVLERHGSTQSVVCTACGARSPTPDALARLEAGELDPPCLACGGILKTASLQVHPAASLVAIAADCEFTEGSASS